ncbi:bleomycin resistance protein [Paenibacillus arenilitoris]|uniref:VOC family protein n=1 Tax=Paenibacillus arenilitoris TaxID=2772299 RepID=A0A927CQK6_9BACL|nr:VOC family protein [Paenibacillus arenilitoris]MBD2871695.1 VOC family protein [Paenibacillus arenilitoris]
MSAESFETAIPILPSRSIDEQLDFYQALGFEVTYRQAKPNLYACVRHRIVELHFFVLKQLDPANSYSMCYVHVPDVDAVYKEFSENLKKKYRKVLTKGLPRISKPSDLMEDRRFNLIDPAGNRLLIGTKHTAIKLIVEETSKFASAFETSYRLMYAKDEPADAAKVLDHVLPKAEEASATLRYRAYVLRADIAVSMEEWAIAGTYVQEANRMTLSDTELGEVAEQFEKVKELRDAIERKERS